MTFFNKNLKYLTSNTNINQNQLANHLGIDRQQITRYLKGNEPNYERLILISKIFNVSIDDLLLKDLEAEEEKKQLHEF